MKKENKGLKIAIIISVILLLLDQITKWYVCKTNINIEVIPNVFNLKLTFNNGIAFVIGQNSNIFTIIVPNIIVLGLIGRFIYLQKERMNLVTIYSLFAVIAGGIGNLIDRILRGFVIDFLSFFPEKNLPVFNLADIYLVIAWIILAFTFAYYTYEEIKNRRRL